MNNFSIIIEYERPQKTIHKLTTFSGNYCGSKRINSLGPKKSIETNISKNGCFHDDKSLWPNFRRIVECEKPQETNYGGSQALLINTVDFIRAFFKEH